MTAVREGWEESSEILGSEETIYRGLQEHEPLISGSEGQKYAMFLMKVEADEIDIKEFSNNASTSGCHLEKSDIAWVKAQNIFEAVLQGKNTLEVEGKTLKLRGCFFDTIKHSLSENTQIALLKEILGEKNVITSCGI